MPNFCENKLTIYTSTREEMAQIKMRLLTNNTEPELDFGCLIPMPTDLDIVCGGYGERSRLLLELDTALLVTDELIADKIMWYFAEDRLMLFLSLLAQQEHWTVGDFITWLKNNPEREQEFRFDLNLGQRYLDNLTKYGETTWYDWRIRHWGCKWNADTTELDIGDNALICFFETPWGPPNQWFEVLCETFPKAELRLEFLEIGGGIAGTLSNDEGTYYSHYLDDAEIEKFAQEVFGYEPNYDSFEFTEA